MRSGKDGERKKEKRQKSGINRWCNRRDKKAHLRCTQVSMVNKHKQQGDNNWYFECVAKEWRCIRERCTCQVQWHLTVCFACEQWYLVRRGDHQKSGVHFFSGHRFQQESKRQKSIELMKWSPSTRGRDYSANVRQLYECKWQRKTERMKEKNGLKMKRKRKTVNVTRLSDKVENTVNNKRPMDEERGKRDSFKCDQADHWDALMSDCLVNWLPVEGTAVGRECNQYNWFTWMCD